MRVDKWLWVVRLTKTRTLAAEAVGGGRVQVNGQRTKPGKQLAIGDEVEFAVGPVPRTVLVRGFAPRRVSAAEAASLYDETPESVERREAFAEARRIAALSEPERGPRPTKRDRRRFESTRKR